MVFKVGGLAQDRVYKYTGRIQIWQWCTTSILRHRKSCAIVIATCQSRRSIESSCTDCLCEDHNGELESGVVLKDTTFIMCIVIALALCWCLGLGRFALWLSFTHSFASLISLLVMGRSIHHGSLPSLTSGTSSKTKP